MLSDPMLYIAIVVFIIVMLYFWSLDRKKEKAELLERIKRLEEKDN